MEVHPLDATRPFTPWHNGLGRTQELYTWPPRAVLGSDELVLRLSRAQIAVPAPFSPLDGIDRILVVLEGAGLELSHGAPRARLRPLEPYRFEAEWPTEGHPVGGPVTVLNVMLRRGRARAEVEVWPLGERVVRAGLVATQACLFVSEGSLRARLTGEDDPLELTSQEAVVLRDLRGGEELELAGDDARTVALVVRAHW